MFDQPSIEDQARAQGQAQGQGQGEGEGGYQPVWFCVSAGGGLVAFTEAARPADAARAVLSTREFGGDAGRVEAEGVVYAGVSRTGWGAEVMSFTARPGGGVKVHVAALSAVLDGLAAEVAAAGEGRNGTGGPPPVPFRALSGFDPAMLN